MDKLEKEHIIKHLDKLVEDISPNTRFVSILQSRAVLSTADLAPVKNLLDEHEKTDRIIKLLLTRTNGYKFLVEALRKTGQTGVASILEEILPSTSKPKESSSSSSNSRTPEKSEKVLPDPPKSISFQYDENNNDDRSFNRNILQFISKTQASGIASLVYTFMQKPVEDASIKIIHTLDHYITTYKLSASKDFPVNSLYYPFQAGETLIQNLQTVNIITLTTSHSLGSLLHEIAQLKNLKAIILTDKPLENIYQTVDVFKTSINSRPPPITTTTDEIRWTDLTSEGKEKLLDKKVKFQENIVRLGDLTNNSKLFENLGSSFIIHLLYGGQQPPTLIRKSGSDPPKCYISRQIHPRSYLSEELLYKADSENVFLVSGIDARGLERTNGAILVDHSSTQKQFQKLTKYLISLDEDAHFQEMCKKAGSATVYWFQARPLKGSSKICLEFKKAHPKKADLSLLQNWADNEFGMTPGITEESFIDGILSGEEPVCIADAPGMGKSALLFKASERIKQKFPSKFVHYSTMPEFMKNITQVLTRRNIQSENIQREHIIEGICESATEIPYEKKFLAKLLEPSEETETDENNIRCELMLDGLDEIVVEDQKNLALKVTTKIKSFLTTTRLWLTCRNHMVRKMENQLNILGISLSPFTTQNQVHYLVSRWTHKELKKNSQRKKELPSDVQTKFRLFAQTCLKNVKQSLENRKDASGQGGSGLELAGNPLQCRLIAGNYYGKASSYATTSNEKERLHNSIDNFTSTLSITELYEAIVQKKWVTYLKKNNMPEVENRNCFYHNATETEFLKKHIDLALKIMFPDDSANVPILSYGKKADVDPGLASFGILSKSSKESLEFIHRTYAEYFVARLVVEFDRFFDGFSPESHQAKAKCIAEFVVRTVLSSPTCEGGFLPALWYGRLENPPYFNYPLVVYFLNDMLGKTMISEEFSLELKQAWKREIERSNPDWTLARPPVFIASILCNHLHIAKLYYNAFDRKEMFRVLTKTSHKDMIILAAKWGNLEFVKFISEDIIGRKVKKSRDTEDRKVAHLFTEKKRPLDVVKRAINTKYTELEALKPHSNPLYAALSRGEVKIAEYLIKYQGFGLDTWKELASRHNRLNVLHVLLRDSWEDSDEKISQKLKLMITILDTYARNNIRIMNEVDEEGRPPILQPKAHVDLVKFLIDKGANVFIQDEQGNTLLHLLCQLEGFQHYCEYKTRLNNMGRTRDGYECTSTGNIFADPNSFIKNYQKMKERDDQEDIVNSLDEKELKNLQSAYHIASNIRFMKTVIDKMTTEQERHEVVFNKKNNLGITPLHNAVLSGNLYAIDLMVRNFEDEFINLKDDQGASALCFVSRSPSGFQMEIANYLLNSGASIRNDIRVDPVLYGLQHGIPDARVIEELERIRFPHGNIKNEDDINKMLVALFKNSLLELKHFLKLLEWILDGRKRFRESIFEDEDEQKRTTLLHLAVQHLSMERFEKVVKQKQMSWMLKIECVDNVDWEGNTALHLAYMLEDETKMEKIAILEKAGADPYKKNKTKKTQTLHRKGGLRNTMRSRPIAQN